MMQFAFVLEKKSSRIWDLFGDNSSDMEFFSDLVDIVQSNLLPNNSFKIFFMWDSDYFHFLFQLD